MRPLGCDRRPPPEFEAPKVLVAEDGNQAGEGLSRSVHPAIEAQKPAGNKAPLYAAAQSDQEVMRGRPTRARPPELQGL
jgi:hypothetical protein